MPAIYSYSEDDDFVSAESYESIKHIPMNKLLFELSFGYIRGDILMKCLSQKELIDAFKMTLAEDDDDDD